MKYIYKNCIVIILALLIFGCLQREMPEKNPPKTKGQVMIEVNSVPFPFNLNENNPYAVWMNGKRVSLPKEDLDKLVNKVGAENIPEINKGDIHKGWLYPHASKQTNETDKLFKEAN